MTKRDKAETSLGKASVAIIVLMFFALLGVLSVWLITSYRTTVHRGDERIIAASKIVAANAIWMNSLARETLHRIDDSLGANIPVPGPDRVHDLNAAVADLPSQVTAYVLGPDGRTLFSNDPNIRKVDVTDRDYFVRLRNGADDYTSALIQSRLSGRQIFVFSRRLERNGMFAGAAVIAFDASILKPVWDAVALGKNSTVSLIRRDGQLVARHPEPDGPVNMKDYVLFTDYMKKSTTGVYRARSPVDDQDRLVAYRIIERTPFVAIASADMALIMQPFWNDVEIAIAMIILAVIGALAAAYWIRGLIRVDAVHVLELADAVKANEMLMREIHHRVKNNLQTVIALIRMQGFEPEAVSKVNERISAMSAVHEQMYGFDQFAGVAARDFVPGFVGKLVNMHALNIETTFDVDDFVVAADKATPLALLLNELVANSMKYAFRGRQTGRIHVGLKVLDNEVCQLVVSDNGIGYGGQTKKPGMGTRLIAAFVKQLKGSFEYTRSNGTHFVASLHLIK
ncbi:histidine kinase dimerization/phosphoacceptor domain -containing protein [Rhizobium sp. BK399]|uniref:sensor histidine kinase n=1 Tax=Rhizobium sp. BK399 TaxID=2587063 RepID=UPI0016215168|nr:histidine kinase dimerization/phosphoacceptor domain -containing protein [Rhizobium sp. BK399]MBB3543824.1 two-component sensor histidine kinase [Rhizobium sp. BK399]